MSRPRLHDSLLELFSSKGNSELISLIVHEDFKSFMELHNLKIPQEDFAQAFIHTSFSHEFQVPHQEQLEFLGDSVLQLILTEELYRLFPEEKEGQLSKMRSAIVNEKTLSVLASSLKLSELILVGKGEFVKKLYLEESVLADTFEALLAQIYRHQGLDFTKNLLLSWIHQYVPDAFNKNFLAQFDAKSKLQELVLARYKNLPRYTAQTLEQGFEVSLWINDQLKAQGVYPSKKAGEKDLAQIVIKNGNI